jgi:hypothetical protein
LSPDCDIGVEPAGGDEVVGAINCTDGADDSGSRGVKQLVDVFEQISDRQIERPRNRLQGSQADFLLALFKVRHIVLVDSCLFGKINLPPAALFPQLPYSLPSAMQISLAIPTIVGIKFKPHPLYSVGVEMPLLRLGISLRL